jgi:16S rRNA (cytosine1402-N4)-methyltransferase
MVGPIVEGLQVAHLSNAIWVDGTLGAGGHSHAILSTRPDSRLIGFDLDPSALALTREGLAAFEERIHLVHASYEQLSQVLHDLGITQVDGILLDLGISSMQVDQAERGFAFRLEGALDMRFDPTSSLPTAAEWVNQTPEGELADLIYRYGEDSNSRRIARAIVKARPITSTTQLAQIIQAQDHTPAYKQKIHPATLTFQALRIAVNDELGAVERVLPQAIAHLKMGGRLAVMSFHSLEDRIVKETLKREATDCLCPPRQPICTCGHRASLELITRKPLMADAAEVQANPRARSAKLRIAQKIGGPL